MTGPERDLMRFYTLNMLDKGFVLKAPGVDYFPGNFESPAPAVSVSFELTTQRYMHTQTGYYLPAGQIATIKVNYTIGGRRDRPMGK